MVVLQRLTIGVDASPSAADVLTIRMVVKEEQGMVEWKSEAIVAVRFQEANEDGRSVGGGRQPSQRFSDATNQKRILK